MSNYQLPIASKSTLGGVKIGDYIKVKEDGTISVDIESTVKELEDALNSIKQGKQLLAEALTNKGVPTSPTDSFQVMAANIDKISIDSSLSNMYLA